MPREDLCDKVLACVLEALLTEFLTVINPYPQENSRLAVIAVAVLDHDELHECHEVLVSLVLLGFHECHALCLDA